MLSWPWGLRPCPLGFQGRDQCTDLDSARSMGSQLWDNGETELKRKTESERFHPMPSQFGVASGVLYPLTCQVARGDGKNPRLRAGRPDSSCRPTKHHLTSCVTLSRSLAPSGLQFPPLEIEPAGRRNSGLVLLGSVGPHGGLSPSASASFGMLHGGGRQGREEGAHCVMVSRLLARISSPPGAGLSQEA